MLSYIKKLVNSDERKLKNYYKIVARINELEPTFEALTDDELRAKTSEFKQRLERGETVFDI